MRRALAAVFFSLLLLLAAANGPGSELSSTPNKSRHGTLQKPQNKAVDVVVSRANAQRTGVYDAKGLPKLQSVAWKTPKLFTLEAKESAFESEELDVASVFSVSNFVTAPLVKDETLYLSIYNGHGFLAAFDTRTGIRKWILKRERGMISPPAIVGETVYIGLSRTTIVGLSTLTGQEKWRYELAETSKPRGAITILRGQTYAPAPVPADNLIVFGSIVGNLYAVDTLMNNLAWTFPAGGIVGSPAVADGTAYFTNSLGFLFAVDLKTGSEKWKAKQSLKVPTVNDGFVYIAGNDGLYCFSAADGKQKWKSKPSGKIGGLLAVAYETIYFAGAEDSLYAVDATNGTERWRFKTKGACDSPIIAGGLVYVGCSNQLFAINAKTGQSEWAFDEKKSTFLSPAVTNESIYLVTEEGFLYSLK